MTTHEIQAVKAAVEASGEFVKISGDYVSPAIGRLGISRRTVQAICRKYAAEWGYKYLKAEYQPSGRGNFGRSKGGSRARTSPACLRKLNNQTNSPA